MIQGDFYSIDYLPIMEEAFHEAIVKYNFKSQERRDKLGIIYKNDKCSIDFWVSDRRSFKWNFYAISEEFKYDLSYYLEFVLKVKETMRPISSSIITIEELVRELFLIYNRQVVEFLELPMKGDFSWHNIYCEGLRRRMKHAEFASRTKGTDSEERIKLAEMFFSGKEGRDDAIESYLIKTYPDRGKEFELEGICKMN